MTSIMTSTPSAEEIHRRVTEVWAKIADQKFRGQPIWTYVANDRIPPLLCLEIVRLTIDELERDEERRWRAANGEPPCRICSEPMVEFDGAWNCPTCGEIKPLS